jgi:hypothetical protein
VNYDNFEGLLPDAKFNLWTFKNLPPSEHVKADSNPSDKKKKVLAFPTQSNPVIYTVLFTIFGPSEDMEKKACIHLNANVCQSLAVYNDECWDIHLWETDASMYVPGIVHAAHEIAEWNWDHREKVIVSFLYSYILMIK